MASYSEDYRELLEEARMALHRLIKNSEPGTGQHVLHTAYSSIKRLLNEKDEEAEAPERKTPRALDAWDRQRREQKAIWKSVSKAERERVAIELTGEGRLTLTELTHKFQDHFGFDGTIYHGHVRSIAMRLLAAGELEREAETFQNKVRYRYFRRTDLSGPIAELERAYHDDEETR